MKTESLLLSSLLTALLTTAMTSILSVHLEAQSSFEPNPSRICTDSKIGTHEHYHLPATTVLLDEISFATDWTTNPTGGWGGEQVMDRCRIQPDGFLTWHGKIAVRVEVQPNDDPLELGANSERAEMLLMQSPDKLLLSNLMERAAIAVVRLQLS